MFHTYAQQNGQYSWIKCSEFTLHLMEKSPTAGPKARVESKVESTVSLNQYTWNGKEAGLIESMIEMVEVNPTRWYLEIQRHPEKVDKRIRDKTHPWHPWKLPNQQSVKYIIHYFVVLHPLINDLAKQKQLGFNCILAFSPTKHLSALSEGHLFHSKCSYFNYCAKQLSFAMVDVKKAKATFWRHTHTTHEMTKWQNKKDYRWCANAEEAATEIAFHMNTSMKEVMDTYSTCYNREQVPIAGTRIHLPDLFGNDDDNNLWEGINRGTTRQISDRSARYASYPTPNQTLGDRRPQTLQNTNSRKRESEILPFNTLDKKPRKSIWTSDGNRKTPSWLQKKGFGVNRR
jgi:hypothetical protein